MTYLEAKAEAEKTRQREQARDEANLLHNIKHAVTAEDRQRARQSYEVWCKHVKFGGP